MLSFPRRRRGKDNRQLYSIPDIKSFILVYQRDDHIKKSRSLTAAVSAVTCYFVIQHYSVCLVRKHSTGAEKGCKMSCFSIISQFGCVLFPRLRRGNNTKEQPFCIISNTHQNWESIIRGLKRREKI